MKKGILFLVLFAILSVTAIAAVWRTPVTRHMPVNEDERLITELFVRHIDARNHGDVETFLATLHRDATYMVSRDRTASKEELAGLLPALWQQRQDDSPSVGRCMAWDCFDQTSFPGAMLVNPQIRVLGDTAEALFQYSAGPGLYLEPNRFLLVRDLSGWRIREMVRPAY